MRVSIIITTYNRPKALSIVLESLIQQERKPDEILVADDGSDQITKALINTIATTQMPIKHIWQEDNGFQAGTIRNKAAAQASGDYLIFLDGDVATFPNFIKWHTMLAEQAWFVTGNRLLLNVTATQTWEKKKISPLQWNKLDWLKARYQGSVNRLLPLLKLPIKQAWRKKKAKQWQGAKTCNLAIWKQDFLNVNGFDESYQGWGHEDADLAIRLIHNNVYRKSGNFAVPVLHLWHPENSRHNEQKNWQQLQERIADNSHTWAEKGVDQHL